MSRFDGVLSETDDGGLLVRFERLIDRPAAKIWAALTDPVILANWFGEVEIEPRLGGKYVNHFREKKVVMTGTITAFEPERVLEFTWLENYGMPQSLLRWELSPAGGGCKLVLLHRFPPGCARKDVVEFLGGWESALDIIAAASDGKFMSWDDETAAEAHYAGRYLSAQ
jgi:uncharacterized protein YndB with AHSA1/START domain